MRNKFKKQFIKSRFFFLLYYGKIALFKNKLLVQYIQKQYIEKKLLYKKNFSVQVKSRTFKLIHSNNIVGFNRPAKG